MFLQYFSRRVAARGLACLTAIIGSAVLTASSVAFAQRALTISEVAASSITSTSATITWRTNNQGDSQVDYGTTVAYSNQSPVGGYIARTHRVVLRDLSPGTLYHYRVRTVDTSGQTGVSGDFTFTTVSGGGGSTTDTTPPAVSITSPSEDQMVTGGVTLSATASDSSGVAAVQFKLNGAAVGAEDTSAPFALALDSTTVDDGGHSITATARDMAGNVRTSEPVAVIVQNDAAPMAGFYVSTSGTPQGDGSVASPWDLQTALLQPAVVDPGATIWLRGGTYRGTFRSRLEGVPGAPITVRAYPGERATLDGNRAGNVLQIYGEHATFWGLEIMNSDTRRTTTISGSSQEDGFRKNGVQVYGPYTKLINLVVHDNATGIGFWDDAINSEIYGCVIFNNGYLGPDRGHGHGIYVQNSAGLKRIRNTISYSNFGTGMKAYAQSASAEGVHFEEIIAFENGAPESRGGSLRNEGILLGTTAATQRDMKVLDSAVYTRPGTRGTGLRLGYTSQGADVEARGNYVAAGIGFSATSWAMATVEQNTFWVRDQAATVNPPSVQAANNYSIDNNTYYDASGPRSGVRRPFGIDGVSNALGGGALSVGEWRGAYGWDLGSAYHTGPLTGSKVLVYPNEYEAGRAHIAVFNFNKSATVSVDVSGLLEVGDNYELRSAENFYGAPILVGVYNGGPLQVPMTGHSVTGPIGYDYTTPTVAPEFGAFVLLPR